MTQAPVAWANETSRDRTDVVVCCILRTCGRHKSQKDPDGRRKAEKLCVDTMMRRGNVWINCCEHIGIAAAARPSSKWDLQNLATQFVKSLKEFLSEPVNASHFTFFGSTKMTHSVGARAWDWSSAIFSGVFFFQISDPARLVFDNT